MVGGKEGNKGKRGVLPNSADESLRGEEGGRVEDRQKNRNNWEKI